MAGRLAWGARACVYQHTAYTGSMLRRLRLRCWLPACRPLPAVPHSKQHRRVCAAARAGDNTHTHMQAHHHHHHTHRHPPSALQLFLPQRSIKGVPPQPLQLPSTGGFAPRAAPARAHPAAAALAGRRAWDEQQVCWAAGGGLGCVACRERPPGQPAAQLGCLLRDAWLPGH
jgi:hypothetical protein